LESCYTDEKKKIPPRISRLLFDEQFNDFSTQTSTPITDAQKRILLINEINALLSKFSKKKQHILPPVILQLVRLRFPQELDLFNPPASGYDVSLEQFIKWTKNIH
jgi:hypothetical protein